MNAPSVLDIAVGPIAIPHVEHLLGVWAIEPSSFDGLVALIQNMDINAHLLRQQEILAASGSATEGLRAARYRQDVSNVAIITAAGTLQKHEASFSAATSTVLMRRAIRDAADDDSVGCVLIHIDQSPGGTAAGTPELGDDIASAGKKKPVYCHITDLGASAAYWVASQCERITANAAALVGSIGTFSVVTDMSGAAAQRGMKVHVVRSGAMKGMGTPGTEITAEHLQELQSVIDSRQEFFTKAVASGRKMSQAKVKELADGRVHAAAEAQRLGLIDGVSTFEQSFAEARVAAQKFLSKSSNKGPKMETTQPIAVATPAVVTPAAIKAACPGCSSDFIVNSLEANRTLEQCIGAHMTALVASRDEMTKQVSLFTAENAKLVEANAKLTAENAELAKRPETVTKTHGVKPLPQGKSTTETHDTPASAYWAKVKEYQTQDKISRGEAMGRVNTNHPDLRDAFQAAADAR